MSKTENDVFEYEEVETFVAGDAANYYVYNTNTSVFEKPSPTPTEAAAGTTYYTQTKIASSGDWVDDKGRTSTAYLMTFKFWIKSNDAATVNVSLKTTNTTDTADVKKQVAVTSANCPTGVSKGDEFAVDAVHALRMNIAKQEFTLSNSKYTTSDTAEGTTYAVDTISTNYTSPTWATADDGDANKYYKSVVGTAGFGTTKADGTSVAAPAGTWTSLSLSANKDTLLTFNVWLEGTDAGCFDSAINQKFTFAFEFELPQQNNQQQNP
jgi:hypothetical protein